MRIILTENDIKKALIAYTSTLGLDLSNHHVAIELTAGRGANGHSATVIIDEAEAEPAVVETVKEVEGTSAKTLVQQRVQKAKEPEPVVEEVEEELPLPTPEAAGHETKPTSLFGD